MSGNKHALTRYRVLDACFSNRMRKYYIEDLVEKCSEALAERYPSGDVIISRRTIFDDLNDLEELVSEYGVEIKRIQDGHKKYYRYDKENFSLFTKGFTEEELRLLRDNVQMLQRFKGLPSFEWMTSLVKKLEDRVTIKSSVNTILSYEENTDYSGIEWLKDCFDAIINQQPIKIEYRNFEGKEFKWVIHPYYIKQYNNRWFLLGKNTDYSTLTNVPLDRIDNIEPVHIGFIPNMEIDFDKYFEHIIGVTVPNSHIQEIRLRFTPKRLQYVLTKPIHKSQKCMDPDNGIIMLQLIPNKEFESLILSFGPDVEVIEPAELREQIYKRIEILYSLYS